MSQFKNIGFTFDNINGEDLGYYVVSTSSNGESYMGVSKKIVEEDTSNFAPSFQGVTYDTVEFTLTIAKINKIGNAVPISEEDIFFLNNWLLKPQDYRIFISHQNRDVLYYAIFTKASNFLNGAREGYINLTMRLSSGCSYSNVAHHIHRVTHSYTMEIYNKSNVEDYVYPDVNFITLFESNDGVRIINETLGETMEFWNLPPNHEFMCYNEGLKQVVCTTNKTLNTQPLFNKKWLRLAYGRNVIRIEGTVKIDIFFQNKIAIQN